MSDSVNSEQFDLPQGWCITNLSDSIGTTDLISDGDWVESKDQDPSGVVRLIQLADVGDGAFRDKSSRFMNEEAAARLNCTFLQKDDVLVARMPDPLGRACIFPGVDQQAVTVVDICIIRSSKSAWLPKVICNWINSSYVRQEIFQNASGTTRKRITRKKLEKFALPLPPLAEQKVIAAKLDELLAQVDSIKARLDAIPTILKRFRQSVLAAAVSGRLTEDWVSESRSINEVCLSCFDGPFGSKLKSEDYTETGVRVARLENIGHLNFNDEKRTYISTEKYLTLTKNTLKPGDLLFSSFVDEEVKVCVFHAAKETYINKADCFCLRPNEKFVSASYLSYVLASITSYEQIKDQVQGVTRPRINLRILKSLTFEFPPLKQQAVIVRYVGELLAWAGNVEQNCSMAMKRINNLTQSILAKAFRGELTAEWRKQNPDLISGENSAEALLERIRLEREAAKPIKRKAKAKRKTRVA